MTAVCGCPQHPGRRISDPARHAAWHQLVVDQGGPAGVVDVGTLTDARGSDALALRTAQQLLAAEVA